MCISIWSKLTLEFNNMRSLKFYSFLRRINEASFQRHPLLTNITLSCCFTGTADYIAQKIIQDHQTLDTERTRHMVTYSCTTAPLWHLWYNMVDRYIKPSRIWLKVILDQTTVTPLDYIGFFAIFNYVKGDTVEKCLEELKRVYFKALIPDTIFWPFVTFVGYKWIPLRYRFFYFEFFGLVWDTFLSYLKYSGEEQSKHREVSTIQRSLFARNISNEYTNSYKISQGANKGNEFTLRNYAMHQSFSDFELSYFGSAIE